MTIMQVWDMLLLGSPQFRLGSKLKKKKKKKCQKKWNKSVFGSVKKL